MRMARAPVLFLEGGGNPPDGCRRKRELDGIEAVLMFLLSELPDHPNEDSIGLAHVPGVVEPL